MEPSRVSLSTMQFSFLLILILFCLSSCSRESALDIEAEGKAQEWFGKTVIKCGDNYFGRYESRMRPGSYAIFELKNPWYEVHAFKKNYTESDRLNDETYDWEGSASVYSTQYRQVFYGEEGRWREGTPRRDPIAGLTSEGPPLISKGLRKKNGQWSVDEETESKFDCSDLPQ